MALFTAQLHPGQALGFLVLGASLHDILTRLKAEPQQFPKLDLVYSPSRPVHEPIILSLPLNGLRLRFDGPQQRLRLIEVVDFSKNKLSYNHVDIVKHGGETDSPSGPTFKHLYRIIGPTFAGEYIPPDAEESTGYGLYVLSYNGIAFTFPILASSWSPKIDYVSLLSASTTKPVASMAIFNGESWGSARTELYTKSLPYPSSSPLLSKGREQCPDEVVLVRIYGGGRLELVRSSGASFWLRLNATTPQEVVAELGPPDAIYRKNDQRMMIHKSRSTSESRENKRNHSRSQDDSTDTEVSSAHTATDDEDGEGFNSNSLSSPSRECFYNYFYHGFDILVSTPSHSSPKPPSLPPSPEQSPADPNVLVATKIILHSNVPGSYPFNRHRRCRWELAYLGQDVANSESSVPLSSESKFDTIASSLHEEWKSIYASPEEAQQRQRGMVLNRGWGDSPGSSCELLGGWEDSVSNRKHSDITATLGTMSLDGEQGLGNTTLFGFPGLVFEVLKNGVVSALTVF